MNKILIIIINIFLALFILNESYAVEPDEILKDTKLELRARDISKNIRKAFLVKVINLLIKFI